MGECTHEFHLHCIMKWLSEKHEPMCPLCKRPWRMYCTLTRSGSQLNSASPRVCFPQCTIAIAVLARGATTRWYPAVSLHVIALRVVRSLPCPRHAPGRRGRRCRRRVYVQRGARYRMRQTVSVRGASCVQARLRHHPLVSQRRPPTCMICSNSRRSVCKPARRASEPSAISAMSGIA